MKPLERSEGAKGRITFAVANILSSDPDENNEAAYNDYLRSAHAEILCYESGESQDIEGGLALLFRTTFKAKIASIIEEYMRLHPGGMENLLQNLWNNASNLSLTETLKTIQENRWDILLLLNGKGTSLHLALLMEAFIQEQNGGIVTTIATTKAKSGHAMLFATGKRRIALPSTDFLLHDATDNRTGACAVDDSLPALKQYFSQKLNEVVEKTSQEKKQQLYEKLKKQLNTKGNNQREIQWQGRESSGYVTEYLNENDPLPDQVSAIIDRPINLGAFGSDTVARFTLESEIERRMREKGHNIFVYSIGDEWKIRGENVGEKESICFKETVIELMNESGHAIKMERKSKS